MKRHLLIVAVFLLAGAVVNVAIAWGCGFASWSGLKTDKAVPAEWPEPIPDHWPADCDAIEGQSFGIVIYRHYRNRLIDPGDAGTRRGSESFMIEIYHIGWPLPALTFQTWFDYVIEPPRQGRHRFDGQPAPTIWRCGVSIGNWARLPLRPVWPGFAINTLLYAALLWLPFVVRRWVRVRRGLCPKCAYPMGESAVCSECGKALPGIAARGRGCA